MASALIVKHEYEQLLSISDLLYETMKSVFGPILRYIFNHISVTNIYHSCILR